MVLVALTNTRDGIILCQSKFELHHNFFDFIMFCDKFRIRSVEASVIMVQIFEVLDEIGLHPCHVYSAKTA